MNPRTYYKRNDMMEAINGNVQEHILLSKDYPMQNRAGVKTFMHLPLTNRIENESYLSVNRNMYEIIPPGLPVKLYFDLEMEYDGLTESHMQHCCEEFIYFVACEIKKLFGVELMMAENDIVIEDSCRENKLSYHIIVNRKICFQSEADMKTFIMYLLHRFQNPQTDYERELVELLSYTTPKGENRFIFDPIPYGSYQNFRFVGQSKYGSPHVLRNWTPYWSNVIDTFVRIYKEYDCEERKVITSEMLSELVQFDIDKQKRNKKNKNISDVVANECEVETAGITLFTKMKMSETQLYQMPAWKRALYLIPNTNQNWQTYRNVAMAVCGAGGTAQDFEMWATLSPKDVGNSVRDYHDFNINSGVGHTYRLTFLRRLAKKCNPSYYENSKEVLNHYFELDTNGMKVIQESSQFVSMQGTPDEHNIEDSAKQIILHAYLGRGKTTAIKRILGGYKSYLFLSSRQTFARFIASEFEGSVCYLDCNGNYNHDKFIVSIESLHKCALRTYDVVVLDECESVFAQFSSTTMNNKQLETWNRLSSFIESSSKVVYADAFLTNRTLDICRHFNNNGEGVCLIQNETPAIRRIAEEVNSDSFCSHLLQSIKKNEKNYVCYSSLSKLQKHMNMLRGASLVDANVKEVMDNSLIYHSQADDSLFDTLNSINTSWAEAKLIVTSPSNTIGCSYSPGSLPDVNNVYVNGFPSCTCRDTFQSQMRVRHLKNNKMVYCLPSSASLNFCKMKYRMQFNLFDEYDNNTTDKKEILMRMIQEMIEKRQKSDASDKCEELVQLLDSYTTNTTPEVLKRLYYFNMYEESVSACYYEDMFRCFLIRCGYSSSKNDTATVKKDESLVQLYNEDQMYENISVLNYEQYKYISQCVKAKKATELMKLQLKKYWFDKLISDEIQSEDRKMLFHEVYCTKHGETYIRHLRALHCGDINKMMKNNSGDECIEMNSLFIKQFEIMKHFNDVLGINPVYSNETIMRSKIEELISYVSSNKKEINIAFKLRDRSKNDTVDFKKVCSILKSVYGDWCGLVFDSVKNKHTKEIVSLTTFQKALKGFDGDLFDAQYS